MSLLVDALQEKLEGFSLYVPASDEAPPINGRDFVLARKTTDTLLFVILVYSWKQDGVMLETGWSVFHRFPTCGRPCSNSMDPGMYYHQFVFRAQNQRGDRVWRYPFYRDGSPVDVAKVAEELYECYCEQVSPIFFERFGVTGKSEGRPQ